MPAPSPPPELSDEDRASAVAPPPDSRAPGSRRESGVSPAPSVLHPRGRIAPPLPASEPTWKRLQHGVIRLVQGLYHHEDIFHAAPAMAFHFFLSLLPLLVFVGYVLGLLAQRQGMSAVLELLFQNLPATTRPVIEQEVLRLAAADRLGPLAAVGFLWIASGGTQGLMQAIERVVGVPRRAWWKQRLIALGWVIATLVAFAVASFGMIEWDNVVHAADEPAVETPVGQAPSEERAAPAPSPDRRRPVASPARHAGRLLRAGGERVVTIAASLVVTVGGLAAFYWFAVKHTHRVRRRVVPGAVVAIALIVAISWAFSLYVRTLASYTVYYGGLAAIAVLLVWLWLVSLAILVGAELNAQLEGLRDLHGDDER